MIKSEENRDFSPTIKGITVGLSSGTSGNRGVFLASEKEAEGIKPFTTDIFKGFLAIFLLDMGITSGKKLKDFFEIIR